MQLIHDRVSAQPTDLLPIDIFQPQESFLLFCNDTISLRSLWYVRGKFPTVVTFSTKLPNAHIHNRREALPAVSNQGIYRTLK